MNSRKVLLIGGTGLVGQALANRLSSQGVRVVMPTRRRDTVTPLSVLPNVDIVRANVYDTDQLQTLMQGVDAVVNLAGVLHDAGEQKPYGYRFWKVHVNLLEKIVYAMRMADVKRLVHVSAIGAAKDAPSGYLRSKHAGETVCEMAGEHLDVTIFRPSIIFGRKDAFLNVFASLINNLPIIPIIGADTKFQPVYVGDVANAIVSSLSNVSTFGQTYELCGPKVYTTLELEQYLSVILGKKPKFTKVSASLAGLLAKVLYLLPNPPLSPDNIKSMQVDYVTDGSKNYPDWNPQNLESVVPAYLSPRRPQMRLDTYRIKAGR